MGRDELKRRDIRCSMSSNNKNEGLRADGKVFSTSVLNLHSLNS